MFYVRHGSSCTVWVAFGGWPQFHSLGHYLNSAISRFCCSIWQYVGQQYIFAGAYSAISSVSFSQRMRKQGGPPRYCRRYGGCVLWSCIYRFILFVLYWGNMAWQFSSNGHYLFYCMSAPFCFAMRCHGMMPGLGAAHGCFAPAFASGLDAAPGAGWWARPSPALRARQATLKSRGVAQLGAWPSTAARPCSMETPKNINISIRYVIFNINIK